MRNMIVRTAAVLCLFAAVSGAQAADIQVVSSGGFAEAYRALVHGAIDDNLRQSPRRGARGQGRQHTLGNVLLGGGGSNGTERSLQTASDPARS